MTDDSSLDSEIAASWDANAEPWAAVVRRGAIPSRRAGTDDAILAACARACARVVTARVLDVGCGEGWLSRALAAGGADVLGIDGSAALVARAREPAVTARFEVADYRQLTEDADIARGPWDVVVCNFSLFGEHLETLLAALAERLTADGVLLVHTVHPWAIAATEPPYADGWRRETWSRFGSEFATSMPWYFRTLGSWVDVLSRAGLALSAVGEPRDAVSGSPLSLLLECGHRQSAR